MKARQAHPRHILIREVPLLMSLRDVLLTLVAWAIIAYFLRKALYLGYDYLRYPYFQLVNAKAPNWPLIWRDLRKFVVFAVCMVVWLTFWAIYWRKKLKTSSMVPQPDPLSLREHAESIGLTEAQLVQCKSYITTTVFFDTQRQITEIRGQGMRTATGGAAPH